MKAQSYKFDGTAYIPCEPKEATHLEMILPGPTGMIRLPVMIGGTRDGTPNWTWNGRLEKPTIKPSVLTRGTLPLTDEQHDRVMKGEKLTPTPFVCHSFINDGKVQFLGDCTHEFKNQTVDLLDWD